MLQWRPEQLGAVRESLEGFWYILEYLPFKRLLYNKKKITYW